MASGPYYAAGDYTFRVTDQGFAESKKGTPYFFLRGTPVEMILPDGSGEPCEKNYEREIAKYLSEKAVEYTIQDLRALGWEGESFKELDPSTPNHLTWIGQVIRVTCEHTTNDAGTWESWGLPFLGSGQSEKPKSDVKIASKLDALFGKIAKESATKKAPAKPAAKREVVQSGSGSNVDPNIPF